MEIMLLEELELISTKIGANRLLIQGPGGNSSIKIGKEMFIKASGKWLVDAKKQNIFVKVLWEKINQNIHLKKNNFLDDAIVNYNDLRPSIETTLHALMPHKVVFHTHPVELLSLLVRKDAQCILKKLLNDFRWSWIDYCCPGEDLTIEVKDTLDKQNSDILILENHGLVVGSNSCEGVVNLTKKLETRFKQIKRFFKITNEKSLEIFAKKINMKPVNHNVIHSLALDDISYRYCKTESTVLYPDQAVFLGPKLNCIELKNHTKKDLLKDNFEYVIIGKKGVFVAENSKPEIEEMLACHSEVLLRVPNKTKLKYLNTNEVSKLLGWEAEIYRQKITR